MNDKYERQKIEFNLAFVLRKEEYQRIAIYENFIRKIAMQLTVLELFDEFLSENEQKGRIEQVCEEIYKQMANGRTTQCYIPFNSLNILSIDYEIKELLVPPIIQPWHVPIPLADFTIFKPASTDLIILKVMNCIDGKKHIKKITDEISISDDKVKLCLQHLYYQGLIDFIDLFQYTNIYRITEKIHLILQDLAEECVSLLAKTSEIDEFDIFDYYCMFSDKCLADFLKENSEFFFKVNTEVFIAYGLLRGIIKRVHKYCIELEQDKINLEQCRKNGYKILDLKTRGMLDGNICMDQICTYLETDQQSIEGSLKDICSFFNK